MSTPQPTDLLGRIYKKWIDELSVMSEVSLPVLRWIFEDWQLATAEPEDVTYKNNEIGGVPGIFVTPIGADPKQVIVFFHGGGFALGSSNSHRKMVGHLAKACNVNAFVLDFRLAPEFKFPAQIEDGVAVITALQSQGIKIEDITPAGDSAIETNDATDFLITRDGLQGNIDRYIEGAVSATNPYANPLFANFTGFPRLYVCAADTESLFDDSVRLNDLAKKAGVDITFSVGKNQQHVFPFQAGNLARADEEIRAIANWYKSGRK